MSAGDCREGGHYHIPRWSSVLSWSWVDVGWHWCEEELWMTSVSSWTMGKSTWWMLSEVIIQLWSLRHPALVRLWSPCQHKHLVLKCNTVFCPLLCNTGLYLPPTLQLPTPALKQLPHPCCKSRITMDYPATDEVTCATPKGVVSTEISLDPCLHIGLITRHPPGISHHQHDLVLQSEPRCCSGMVMPSSGRCV